jgi:hypothetical protein
VLQVVYSYAFGMILFGDRLSLMGVGGTLLVAAGVMLVTHNAGARRAPPASCCPLDCRLHCNQFRQGCPGAGWLAERR